MFRVADAEIAEAIVWHLWQEHLPRNRKLRLTDGRQLRVFSTGVFNEDSGPDFLNADLAFGPGQPVRGDVEIHVRPSDWRRHGHEADPRYNFVILHVVMWNDEEDPSILKHSGQYVPTLVLSDCLLHTFDRLRRRHEKKEKPPSPHYPCAHLMEQAPESTRRLLMDAGEARLRSKAQALKTRMTRVSAEQALYEGLMRAGGYSKNTEPFHELAQRLPLAVIRELVLDLPLPERVIAVQTLLFGVAGLLPSQNERTDASCKEKAPYITEIEARWMAFQTAVPARPMAGISWQFFRLRPFNFPTVRLAGLSYLIAAVLDDGLDTPFLQAMEGNETTPRRALKILQTVLDRLFLHARDDYWISHSIFGRTAYTGRSHLIGIGRRREMMVNVILPFLFVGSDEQKRLRILDIYALHPKLPGNTIAAAMQAVLFARASQELSRVIDTAQSQQGMFHIENKTCYRKDCGKCVLNRALPLLPDLSRPQQFIS